MARVARDSFANRRKRGWILKMLISCTMATAFSTTLSSSIGLPCVQLHVAGYKHTTSVEKYFYSERSTYYF